MKRTWDQGRSVIEDLVHDNHLQVVPASREHAERLLRQARQHLASAEDICTDDPHGAYALIYDAARKALTALLENQGLRPTSAGGHIAVYRAIRAQLDPPLGPKLQPFDRMRRHRRDAEYPSSDTPEVTADDVAEDRDKSIAMIEIAKRLLDEMPPFRMA